MSFAVLAFTVLISKVRENLFKCPRSYEFPVHKKLNSCPIDPLYIGPVPPLNCQPMETILGAVITKKGKICSGSARKCKTALRKSERVYYLFVFHVTHKLPFGPLLFPNSGCCSICLICFSVKIQHNSYELI